MPAEKRAIRAEASAASECTMSGRSPVIRAQPVGELVGVLLVDRDDQAARLRVVAGAQAAQLGVARRAGRG